MRVSIDKVLLDNMYDLIRNAPALGISFHQTETLILSVRSDVKEIKEIIDKAEEESSL